MYTPECRLTVNGTIHSAGKSAAMIPGILARTAVLALLWWIIAQGQVGAWLIGLPAVAAAAMASFYLGRAWSRRISPTGMAVFIVLFLRESVRGGLDVARRTLAPRLRINPGFKDYRLQLTDPLPRVLLINCVSLLPGTLAARLEGDRVELHLLDVGNDPEPGLHRLEQAIARLFGLSLEATDV
jgi:multicomponent Na+:H+ antiporter subunit E